MTHKTEIAFIDRSITDLDTFLAEMRPEVEAIVLDAEIRATTQIAENLRGHSELQAVHIVAHGKSGAILFSSGDMTSETLAGQAQELADIGRSLGNGGGLCLWTVKPQTVQMARPLWRPYRHKPLHLWRHQSTKSVQWNRDKIGCWMLNSRLTHLAPH